jgi:hypothetical protein
VFLDIDPLSGDFPAPPGAPAATCNHCHRPIYQRPDGAWTLGRAPWWCYPDNDLIGALGQYHCAGQCPDGLTPEPSPTVLYRLYDDTGGLLYVGVSGRWFTRMGEHAASKSWWEDVSMVRRQTWPSRAEALAAEAQAIRAERPRYNITRAADPGPAPD